MFLFCDIYTMGSVDLALPLLENWEDLIRQWSLKSCLHVLMITVCGEQSQMKRHRQTFDHIPHQNVNYTLKYWKPSSSLTWWWLCMIPELWIVPEMLVIVGEKMQNWLSFLFDWEKNVKLNSRSYVKIYISMKLTADMKVVGPKKEKKRDEKKKNLCIRMKETLL